MANIRIDNFSDDCITVIFDETEYIIPEDESKTINGIEKGQHTIVCHRTRIPIDGVEAHKEKDYKDAFKDKAELHTQLDTCFVIDVNSSKSSVGIKRKLQAVNKIGANLIFSEYEIELTGAKAIDKASSFASKATKKKFIANQFREAFLPIGVGGIIFLVLAITALSSLLAGEPIKIADKTMSAPWTATLFGIFLLCFAYVIYVLAYMQKCLKKYKN